MKLPTSMQLRQKKQKPNATEYCSIFRGVCAWRVCVCFVMKELKKEGK